VSKWRLFLTIVIIALSAHVATAASSSTKPLTNKDVIALVEAGLPDGVVIEKIRTSKRAFDTSTDALLALKKAGVSASVIQLMVNPEAKLEAGGVSALPWQTASGPEPCKTSPGGVQPWLEGASPAMWYSETEGSNRIEMQYERGATQFVGFMGIGATLLVLRPLNAYLRLKPGAVFISCIPSADAPLVRFTMEREDNERNTSVSRGMLGANYSFSISADDIVPVDSQKTPQGFWIIKPRTELGPGEYGFVPQGVTGFFSAGDRVYTFGIDGEPTTTEEKGLGSRIRDKFRRSKPPE